MPSAIPPQETYWNAGRARDSVVIRKECIRMRRLKRNYSIAKFCPNDNFEGWLEGKQGTYLFCLMLPFVGPQISFIMVFRQFSVSSNAEKEVLPRTKWAY